MGGLAASTCGSRIARIVAGRPAHAPHSTSYALDKPERADGSHAGPFQMHAFAQWVTRLKHGNQTPRECVYNRHFHAQTGIPDTRGEWRGCGQKVACARREIAQTLAQCGRAFLLPQI